MSAPLRVGVVGCGGIAQMMHLPTLAERPDLFSIAALADVSRETLDAVAQRYGVAFRTEEPRELIGRPQLDAVLLLSSGSHRDMATAALEAGKHVFVEKPLGFGVAETEAIAAVARKSQGKLMVGYHKRFDPHYLRARDEVRSMKDLRYAEVTVLHPEDAAYRTHHVVLPLPEKPWAPPPEAETYRGLFRDAAEGPLAEGLTATLGSQAPAPLAHRVGALLLFLSLIHDVDAVRGILGEPEEVVSAAVWREGLAQHSLTRFPKDVRVSMSWISLPGLKHYEERLRFCSPEKRVTLTFPSPYLRHLPTPLEIETTDGEAWVVERPVLTYEEAFRAELHHFRDCVVSGRQPSTGVDDALGDARWIEKIARAYARA